MAEFCKECFKSKVAVPSDNITDDKLMLSAAYDICKGCGKYKPMVVGVEHKSVFEDIKDRLQEFKNVDDAIVKAIIESLYAICDELNKILR